MAEPPVCHKCWRKHYRFVACEAAFPKDEPKPEAAPRSQQPPIVVRQPRTDGLTDWHVPAPPLSKRTAPLVTGRVQGSDTNRPPLSKPKPTLTYPEA